MTDLPMPHDDEGLIKEVILARVQIDDAGIPVIPSMYAPKSKHDRRAYEGRVHAAIRRAMVEDADGGEVSHERVKRAAESFLAFMDSMGS